MDRERIKEIIPHREPMLLIDEVTIDENGNSHGYYQVTGEEWFLQGHYPGNPIVPGVIQCEMAAQACCLLFSDSMAGKTPLFTGIKNVKFQERVKPGDALHFVCSLTKQKPPFYFAEVKAYANEKRSLSGEFSFALIDND